MKPVKQLIWIIIYAHSILISTGIFHTKTIVIFQHTADNTEYDSSNTVYFRLKNGGTMTDINGINVDLNQVRELLETKSNSISMTAIIIVENTDIPIKVVGKTVATISPLRSAKQLRIVVQLRD
jgi:hypothetical protein